MIKKKKKLGMHLANNGIKINFIKIGFILLSIVLIIIIIINSKGNILNTKKPIIKEIILDKNIITSNNLNQSITIIFDKKMDVKTKPDLKIKEKDILISLNKLNNNLYGYWKDDKTYFSSFELPKTEEYISINISKAKDISGNIQKSANSNAFYVDTIQPEVIDVELSKNNINEENLNQKITVKYSEEMNTNIKPKIKLIGLDNYTENNGTWKDNKTYLINFNIEDNNEEKDVNINIEGAKDKFNNIQTPYNSKKFYIDTIQPEVVDVELSNYKIKLSNLTQIVTIKYSEEMNIDKKPKVMVNLDNEDYNQNGNWEDNRTYIEKITFKENIKDYCILEISEAEDIFNNIQIIKNYSGFKINTYHNHSNDSDTNNDPNPASSDIEGLISHWTFDYSNSSGPNNKIIIDVVGGNNGTSSTTPTFIDDQQGSSNSAISFDGVYDYIDINDSDDLDLNSNFTINLWLNTTPESRSLRTILSKGNYSLKQDNNRYIWSVSEKPTTWTLNDDNLGCDYITSCSEYNSKLYATCNDGNIVRYDGNVWENTSFPESSSSFVITYKNKLYATSNGTNKVYSYDGNDWNIISAYPGTEPSMGIIYDDKLFIGSNADTNRISIYDGNNWTLSEVIGGGHLSFAIYDNNLFVSCVNSRDVWTYDGNTWSQSKTPFASNYTLMNMVTYKDKLYLDVLNTDTLTSIIWYFDGNSWNEIFNIMMLTNFAIYDDQLFMLSYGGYVYSYDDTNLFCYDTNTNIKYEYAVDPNTLIPTMADFSAGKYANQIFTQPSSAITYIDKMYIGDIATNSVTVFDGNTFSKHDSSGFIQPVLLNFDGKLIVASTNKTQTLGNGASVSIPISTGYNMITAYYDEDTNKIGISLNENTAVTKSYHLTTLDSNCSLKISKNQGNSLLDYISIPYTASDEIIEDYISDLRIYHNILTDENISSLYDSQKP